jgi:prepilin-type N-terminal cleavage/methylation domain-containing protein
MTAVTNRKENPKTLKNRASEAGFTLIELSIVLIILSVTLAAFGSAFMQYLKNAREDAVKTRIEAVETGLTRFLALNGRYPCPAALDAAPDTATYGVEVSANCSTAATGTGTFLSAGTAGRRVRVGAVPVRTLNLPDEYAGDAWANRIMYAVTEVQASPGTFQQGDGAIAVVDTANNSVITPAGSAHYVVFSVGPDSLGSYTIQGVAGTPCNTAALDGENCDLDATFRATVLYSNSGTATQYDDFIRYIGAQSLDDDIPTGAVIPFNLATCPPGWAAYADGVGRTIVGAGNYAENYNPGGRAPWNVTQNYTLGTRGGFMTWRQNENEIATHDHEIPMNGYQIVTPLIGFYDPIRLSSEYTATTTASRIGRNTFEAGLSEPMQNMQPYVALLYCQKL